MDKYYVPSIEEFHEGFEYEELIGGLWETDTFEPSKYEDDKMMFNLGWVDEGIRVKYLDQEDIESLGFIVKQKPLASWSKGEYDVYDLSGAVMDFENIDPTDPIIEFNGVRFKIKNKSELKRVLKQIGYEGV